jgi:Cu-Zn family superoxide dismutase
VSHRRRTILSLAGIIIAAIATVPWISGLAWDSRPSRAPRTAVVTLHDASGASIGEASLTRRSGEVRVDIAVRNLTPGFHGFHVHSIGVCDAASGYTSAGGHLNPGGGHHPEHAADMPVLFVKQDGSGATHFITDRFQVNDLFDADGSALIIHAAPDNYANIPARYAPSGPDEATLATGDAGPRAACGVVERR